jgi:uncharacterized protein
LLLEEESGSLTLCYSLFPKSFLGKQETKYIIARQSHVWTLNGSAVPGLDRFVDLDLGFTPATNLQQLRRVPIAENESAQVPVVWLDIETGTLIELSRRYWGHLR